MEDGRSGTKSVFKGAILMAVVIIVFGGAIIRTFTVTSYLNGTSVPATYARKTTVLASSFTIASCITLIINLLEHVTEVM